MPLKNKINIKIPDRSVPLNKNDKIGLIEEEPKALDQHVPLNKNDKIGLIGERLKALDGTVPAIKRLALD